MHLFHRKAEYAIMVIKIPNKGTNILDFFFFQKGSSAHLDEEIPKTIPNCFMLQILKYIQQIKIYQKFN
tara:strand:+ start:106 stop:312 length:207 start_codon:yes stop_codon:yes gene_type:complete